MSSRTRPQDPAWPSEATWAALREEVGGALSPVAALIEVADDPEAQLRNPFWIGDQAGGTQVSGWHNAWRPASSAFALRARDADDVMAGVNFARRHNLRLVVRGGGHSYLGQSNAPDSLMIWTRGMREVAVHDHFVPQGGEGRVEPVPAVSAQAGAVWADLYDAVTVRGGRYVQGGGCMTVGVAGLIQGGGFGIFSKRYGMAASWLIEADIVTADGILRTVNAHQEPDLFWALKGGGGGTFGVVTRVTLQTHDLPEQFGNVRGAVVARSDAAFQRLTDHFFRFYRDYLLNPHWGDHYHFGPGNTFELAMVYQDLSLDEARTVWAPLFAWIDAAPDDYGIEQPFEIDSLPARMWWAVDHSPLLTRDARETAAAHHGWSLCDQDEVGVYLHHYDSLWLPDTLLDDGQRDGFTQAVFAATRHQMVRFQTAKGLSGAPETARAAARDTPINAGMIDAFALAVVADGEGPAYPGLPAAQDIDAAERNAEKLRRAIAELRRVAPKSGSYIWETSYFLDNWQQEFWGEHYPRLLGVKQRYDPDAVFVIHHGVGSEGWSADGFSFAPR